MISFTNYRKLRRVRRRAGEDEEGRKERFIGEENEKHRHIMAYWDKALPNVSDNLDKKYLMDRYYER